MTELISPRPGETVSLHTREQTDFLEKQRNSAQLGSIDWTHPERSGHEESTRPDPVVLRFRTDTSPSTLEIWERKEPDRIMRFETCTPWLAIDNLKIGTRYCWRVNDSAVSEFMTDPTPPRFLNASGVSNLRDLGGWQTRHGRRIRQGLLYRCGKPDSLPGDCGKDAFARLGIRTELDLRREMLEKAEGSVISDEIDYVLLPCDGYRPFLVQKSECKAIFELLADASRYPMIFHCVGGADRTGTLSFLLQALCGVSEGDLYLDYEITTLSIWGERSRNAEYFTDFLSALREYGNEEDSIEALTVRFLLDSGISVDRMEKIKQILLEDEIST